MKAMNVVRKYGKKAGAQLAVGAVLLSGASVALADAAAAEAKMQGAESDVNTIGWAGIGLLIAAVLFKYIRRAA